MTHDTYLHHDEEERQVRVASGAVAVEVDARAHLVAVSRRVERLRVERQDASFDGLPLALHVVADLPDEHAVVVGRFEALTAQVQFRQSDVVQSDRSVVRYHLLP